MKIELLRSATLGAALFSAQLASAETAVPDCEQEPACMTLWDRASELSKQGNLPESQRMYEMAYDLRADPRLLFNIARVLHKRGLLAEAAARYQRFLKSTVRDPDQKSKALAYLEEVRAALPPGETSRKGPSEPLREPAAQSQPQPVPAAQQHVPKDPREGGRRLLIAGSVTAGLGLLGALAAAGLYAAGSVRADQVHTSADEFEKLSLASQVRQLDTGATVGLIVGSALMAGGAVMIGIGANKYRAAQRDQGTVRGLFVPMNQGAALLVGGRF